MLFNIKWLLRKLSLNEGLVMSYPHDKMVELLSNEFGSDFVHDGKSDLIFRDCIFIVVPDADYNNPSFAPAWNKILNLTGYYELSVTPKKYILNDNGTKAEEDTHVIQIEQKFKDEDYTDRVYRGFGGLLYHITRKNVLNKVLCQGLSPRCEEKFSWYPPSIYLVGCGTPNFNTFVNKCCIPLANRLKDAREKSKQNNKYGRTVKYLDDDLDYVLLKVDLNKCNHKLKFYFDDTNSDSFYTFENIPPQCLTKVADL